MAKALVIFVNGEQVCSVGLTPSGVRSVSLAYIGGREDLVFLNAGGMEDRNHVDWELPELEVGDEVTIKVTECDVTDPPSSIRSIEEVDQWARSLRPVDKVINDDIPSLPAPWE